MLVQTVTGFALAASVSVFWNLAFIAFGWTALRVLERGGAVRPLRRGLRALEHVPRLFDQPDREGVHRHLARRARTALPPRMKPLVITGPTGAGKTTLLRMLAGIDKPDTGKIIEGHGLKVGYFAQEHDTLDNNATVWENIRHAAPDTGEQDLRSLLGAFMFTGPQLEQPAGTLSGGEKTRLALAGLVASTANVLLLDEPTNNLDPASREQVLDALRSYAGAVVLVTHDPGAAEALEPQRVVLLPDGTDPMFWASKMHFFISGVSFYNFPYVFGYLLSRALFSRFQTEGAAFLPGYEAFLRLSGSAGCETVARETLGADLTDPAFWASGILSIEPKLAEYEAFTTASKG